MNLPQFGVEEWLNENEMDAQFDLASVSIAPLSLEQLLDLTGTDKTDFYTEIGQSTLNYCWIEGSPAFKEAVCQLYHTVQPDMVLQTNGATGANLLVLYSLLNPGDHVISLYPSYQQLYDIPRSLGAEVDYWHIKEELNWLPDLDDLRQLIRPETKMICINNANNPTGAIMDRAYLQELVAIARSCGAYILADEVYQSFGDVDVPAVVDLYERGISVNSLSKSYSLPGLRVGWVAAHPQITDQLRGYRDYTMICAGVFDDKVASLALQNRSAIAQRNRQLITKNLAILSEWVDQEPRASFIQPPLTSTSFVKLELDLPVEDFCRQLLRDQGVLLVPGNRFDTEGHVRLGYACETAVLSEGLRRLSLALATT